MDPDGEERLDGGARRLLLPHLGLLRPVRHVRARPRDRLRAARGRRSSRASAASGSSRRRTGGIVIYALLEGPRVTGAYRMATAAPATGCSRTSSAASSCAATSSGSGIAPLTSMFWYGKNNHFVGPDWRPEIHDSDGLAMWTRHRRADLAAAQQPAAGDGERLRADRAPRGFGLAQRERSFEEYQDDGVFYEKRATVWVEPRGDWGEGSVMLVELPTNDEIHDNIVAFWNPAGAGRGGQELRPRATSSTG